MQCPGQDSRYWVGDDVFETKCPQCGHVVEFFKDDSQRKCGKCGTRVLNPKMDFGCASYCPHADQCLGSMPPELLAKRDDLFKDRVTIQVRKFFGPAGADSFTRAQKIADYAEKIGREEKGDMAVLVAGSLLLGVGSAEKAEEILTELKADSSLISKVVAVLRHHHAQADDEPAEYRIIHDAEQLVQLEDGDQEACASLQTAAARALADKIVANT